MTATLVDGLHGPNRRHALLLLTLAAVGCATGYGRGGLARGGTYTAPTGNFSMAVPRSIFGTQTQDGSNENGRWVRFTSDDGSVWQVEYYPMPEDNRAMLADSATNDRFTSGFFHDVIVKDYQASNPGSEVLASEFVTDSVGRAYFAVLRVTGGSAAMENVNGEFKRLDAIMHLLLFPRGEWFYVLKVVAGELGGGDRDNPTLTPDRAMSFRQTITFTDPRS